jgi:hypothetical protein
MASSSAMRVECDCGGSGEEWRETAVVYWGGGSGEAIMDNKVSLVHLSSVSILLLLPLFVYMLWLSASFWSECCS